MRYNQLHAFLFCKLLSVLLSPNCLLLLLIIVKIEKKYLFCGTGKAENNGHASFEVHVVNLKQTYHRRTVHHKYRISI